MVFDKVIVFGPTGNVGSVAALTAQRLGAKVVLAMRDTQKTIPDLSADEEKKGGFERVQADLTQPESITAAVAKTQAKSAFVYLKFMPDGMKATIQALKSSGIEFVVFLSSYTVAKDNLKEIPRSDIIAYGHAQAELSLQEIYGKENYVAVRPGYFATNTLRWKNGIQAGELKLPYPEATMDCTSPMDMGRVSGSILANGKHGKEHFVYLFGPNMLTGREIVETIGKTLNKDIKIIPLYGEDALESFKTFVPEPIARYFVESQEKNVNGFNGMTDKPWYEEGKTNIEKYSGKPAETFSQWAERNKQLFTV